MTSILTQATVAALNGSLGSADVAVRNISVSQSGGAPGSRGCLPQLVLSMAKSSHSWMSTVCWTVLSCKGTAAALNLLVARRLHAIYLMHHL